MTQQTDASEIKARHRKDWDRAAPRWRSFDERLRRAGEPLTRRLLELAGIKRGQRVLDIASGTGEPGLPAAEAVGPKGSVLLTDQSPEMLAVARDKALALGLANVEFRVCDAEA
ncbi:MAG: methyltransferase domain-containing protein, partial [Vicinamibacterales bacterium]